MPEENPVRVARSRGTIIATVFGALIGASFGRVWLNIAAKGLPEWRAPIQITGWVVLGIFLVTGLFVALRSHTFRQPQWASARPNRAWAAWFGVVVTIEIALIAIGQNLLSTTLGHPEWTAVWTLFVVGAHFWPLALILRLGAFRMLTYTLCAVAVASALIAGFIGMTPLWSILPGIGGAAVLWGFTGWALHRMTRGRAQSSQIDELPSRAGSG